MSKKDMCEMTFDSRDIPISDDNDDMLETKKYTEALTEFVKNCKTPMSIALQGDWGTGKTSFINIMKSSLENVKSIKKIVYFNTWQYSQFNLENKLYSSLILCIINKLIEDEKFKIEDDFKKKCLNIVKIATKIGFSIGRQYIEKNMNINMDLKESEDTIQDGVDSIFTKLIENNNTITDLKKKFEELIKAFAGEEGRVVIFIDDLDRLNPEVAVALLENIKLFMDVEKCVFVLAIDYDVVVRGIRKKYGQDMDDQKCKKFFDKIIQLPFRMPTENYQIDKMIEKSLIGKKIENYTIEVCGFIKSILGANPRTIKRLANSFELLTLVQNESNDYESYQNALLLVGMIWQIYDEKKYEKLLSSCEDEDDTENLKVYLNEENADIKALDQVIKKIGKKKYASDDNEDLVYKKFIETLSLSMMTAASLSDSSQSIDKGARKNKVNRIKIYEKEITVKNPTIALVETVSAVLEKLIEQEKESDEIINEIIRKFDKWFTENDEEKSGMFAFHKEININNTSKKSLFLATKNSFIMKINFVHRLCEEYKIEREYVQWFDENEEVLWNDK